MTAARACRPRGHALGAIVLPTRAADSLILLLQNIRPGDEALLETCLTPNSYLIGYPFKAGGGREEGRVDAVIFGGWFSHTMLGEPDGRITPRLRAIAGELRRAGMSPCITRKIVPYIRTHYIWAAATVGAYLKAGSFERFLEPAVQREACLAMREGWEICRAQGINPLGSPRKSAFSCQCLSLGDHPPFSH